MNLKQFAERNGLNYQTAKTWLRRGKIVETSDGFRLADGLKPETHRAKSETLKPEPAQVSESETKSETLKPKVSTGRSIADALIPLPALSVPAFLTRSPEETARAIAKWERDHGRDECGGCAELARRVDALERNTVGQIVLGGAGLADEPQYDYIFDDLPRGRRR